MSRPNARHVFLNCPFDDGYRPLLRAMQFTVLACGCFPRCALEEDNAAEVRVGKIMRLIRDECLLGIHDISRTECDGDPPLPRFNMPFELGLHLGRSWSSRSPDRSARILILDKERYRYQRYISDISGQDIRSHGGTAHGLIAAVRSWLNSQVKGNGVIGTAAIQKSFDLFLEESGRMLTASQLSEDDLSFATWSDYMFGWLQVASRKQASVCPLCGK